MKPPVRCAPIPRSKAFDALLAASTSAATSLMPRSRSGANTAASSTVARPRRRYAAVTAIRPRRGRPGLFQTRASPAPPASPRRCDGKVMAVFHPLFGNSSASWRTAGDQRSQPFGLGIMPDHPCDRGVADTGGHAAMTAHGATSSPVACPTRCGSRCSPRPGLQRPQSERSWSVPGRTAPLSGASEACWRMVPTGRCSPAVPRPSCPGRRRPHHRYPRLRDCRRARP